MVVDGRHAEDALAAELEGSDLEDDRDRLGDEDDARDWEKHHEPRRECAGRERRADGERAGVAHDEFGGVHVEPEKCEERTDHRRAEHDEPVIVARRRDESEREEGEHARASGEPVHAVGEVHPVRHRHDREQREQNEDRASDDPLADQRNEVGGVGLSSGAVMAGAHVLATR